MKIKILEKCYTGTSGEYVCWGVSMIWMSASLKKLIARGFAEPVKMRRPKKKLFDRAADAGEIEARRMPNGC